MRIIPSTEAAVHELKLDLTKPIIEFDPWPFEDEFVRTSIEYFVDVDGTVSPSGGEYVWSLQRDSDRFVGRLTDGQECIICSGFFE